MKYEIDFSHFPDYVRVTTFENATVAGFKGVLEEILCSPLWVAGTPLLLDHRRLSAVSLSVEELQLITEYFGFRGNQFGSAKCAIVVSDSLSFGYSRMYELMGGNRIHEEMGVFYDVGEAIQWLAKKSDHHKIDLDDEDSFAMSELFVANRS